MQEAAVARMSPTPRSLSGQSESLATEGSESACITPETTANPGSSSPQSLGDPGPNQATDTVDGFSSSHSHSPPCSAPNTHVSKFVLPSQWRPSIMHIMQKSDEGERRRLLTPDIRNAVVRDLVSSMYAYTSQPKREFCTTVAKKLVGQYPFMKDAGSAVSGYVSFHMRSYRPLKIL